MGSVTLRLYGDLSELARADERGRRELEVTGRRGVKDLVESLGVPHTEIGMLLVDGDPVGLDERVRSGQRVAVYPRFGRSAPPTGRRLRPEPARPVRFLLDVHLGRLARRLRTLGLDAAYAGGQADGPGGRPGDDEALARAAVEEDRVLLTRDRELLMRGVVVHGALIRSEDADEQALEVLRRFPVQLEPFSRCVHCNGRLRAVDKAEVLDELPPRTRVEHDTFTRCEACGQVYWPGSHRDRMQMFVMRAHAAAATADWHHTGVADPTRSNHR